MRESKDSAGVVTCVWILKRGLYCQTLYNVGVHKRLSFMLIYNIMLSIITNKCANAQCAFKECVVGPSLMQPKPLCIQAWKATQYSTGQ